jgi:hypothetical protein
MPSAKLIEGRALGKAYQCSDEVILGLRIILVPPKGEHSTIKVFFGVFVVSI